MNNVRGLFPPLYGAPANGGSGGGGSIQVDTLPEASLEYKDQIVQYTGATTETLTNGYFYKCVEHTETAGETITVTYSWDNIPVMEAESGGVSLSSNEILIGDLDGVPLYAKLMTFRTSSSYAVLPLNYNIQWYDAIFQRYASGVTYSHWQKGGNGYGDITIDATADGLTFSISNSSYSEVTVKFFVLYTKN